MTVPDRPIAPPAHPDLDDRARFEQVRTGGRRVHPLTPLAKGFIYFALLLGFAVNVLLDAEGSAEFWFRMAVLMSILFASGVVAGFLTWRNTRFALDPDAMRLTTGAFFRVDRTIYYRQIQSIDVTVPIAARLLGLAGLSIDLSGSDGSAKLEFLRPAAANALRDELLEQTRQARLTPDRDDEPGSDSDTGSQGGSAQLNEDAAADRPEHRVLYRHRPGRLIVAALISSSLPLAIGGLAYAALDIWLSNKGFKLTTALVLLGTVGPIVSFITSRWDLTVRQTDEGITVDQGLFSRRSESVVPGRVQGIVVREPVLWRRAGWRSVHLDVAQGGLTTTDPLVTVLAAGTAEDMMRIVSVIAPEFDRIDAALQPAPRAARWLRPLAWRHMGHGALGPVIVARRGWWVRTTSATLHRRVQGLVLKQGPLQRRLDLCSVTVPAPMDRNPLRIAEIHTGPARQLVLDELTAVYAAKASGRRP